MNLYNFVERLEDKNYRVNPEELEELSKFIKNETDYFVQKVEGIAKKICDLGYADSNEPYFNGINSECDITFFIGDFILDFIIDHRNNNIKIIRETYDHYCHRQFGHDLNIGEFSFDTFAFILDLFKIHGKYANDDNPDMTTVFNNHRNMNTKSARTVL